MDNSTWLIALEALRVLFIVGTPLLLGLFSASLIVGGVQLFLGFYDQSFSFCVRLVAIVIAIYLILPSAQLSLAKLLELAVSS